MTDPQPPAPPAFLDPNGLPAGGAASVDAHSPERVEAELARALARHLLAGRRTADVGQVILAAVTVFVFWNVVPRWMSVGWLALFVGATLAKAAYRSRVTGGMGPGALTRLIRRDVWSSAALWGGWALSITGADPKDVAILLIVFAGLIAAATSTLVADRVAFGGFVGVVIGAAAVAVLVGGVGRDRVTLLLLIGLYVPFMLVVFRRSSHLLADQIRTAVRLRMSEEDAARRGDFLNTLLMSAPSPMVVMGPDGTVVRTNPAFGRVMGIPWEEAVGRRLEGLVSDGGEPGGLEDFLDTVRAGRRVVRELPLRTGKGASVWMRLSGTLARDFGQELVILVGEDVTVQVAARQAADVARTEAEHAARAKSAFLATMSHEIRTPMNGILGMTELLLDTELTQGQRESAEIIRASGRGLLRILNDVLDVSKMEAGQLDLELTDFDLAELMSEIVRSFSPQAAAKGLELLLDFGDVPLRVVGDADRIRQILTNLLSNAVKFTEEGEVTLALSSAADGQVRFEVADTGIGIADAQLGRIFQEFEQADMSTTRAYGGTGLGLAICSRLVELMDGSIGVDSAEGEGSRFHFVLPLAAAGDGTVAESAPPGVAGGRFLVVDDNASARRIVREALEGLGAAEVVEAPDAPAAVRALAGPAAFTAMLLDQDLRGQGGVELAREARARGDVDVPPILLLTSAGAVSSWDDVRAAGIGGYLAKPVSRLDVSRGLRGLLDHSATVGPEPRSAPGATDPAPVPVRILLAEDNAVNQHVATALLRKKGHEVVAVRTGLEALDTARAGGFDLVLMDVQMPEMDGLEATRRIRALPGCGDLPIVALTAHAFAEERERCQEAGMSDFLAKPFQPDALYEMVARWAPAAVAGRDGEAPGADERSRASIPAEEGAGPVDLEEFRSVMREAGIEEVVDVSLQMYLTDTPAMVEELSVAVAEGDAHTVHQRAHSLKSASGNIRAKELAALLQRLEDMGREGNVGAAPSVLERVLAEYRSVIAYLEEERSA